MRKWIIKTALIAIVLSMSLLPVTSAISTQKNVKTCSKNTPEPTTPPDTDKFFLIAEIEGIIDGYHPGPLGMWSMIYVRDGTIKGLFGETLNIGYESTDEFYYGYVMGLELGFEKFEQKDEMHYDVKGKMLTFFFPITLWSNNDNK